MANRMTSSGATTAGEGICGRSSSLWLQRRSLGAKAPSLFASDAALKRRSSTKNLRPPKNLRTANVSFPGFHQVVGRVVGDRHDGENRIEPAIVDMNASVDHIHIVDVVHAAVLVHD